MNYKLCKLFGMKSKKILFTKLGSKEKTEFFSYENIIKNISPYIAIKNDKKRLVEAPSEHLSCIQRNLQKYLSYLDYPDYVQAGIKGKSYITNAKCHIGGDYIFKIDISSFFPSITRNRVYYFFYKKLSTSKDVAKILTDLTTVNLLKYRDRKNYIDINTFMMEKDLHVYNHIITGAATSILLAYLVNEEMFAELNTIALEHNMVFTIYVDDGIFSSNRKISKEVRMQILKVINKYGYKVSKQKVKYYKIYQIKKITGVIIDGQNKLKVPNKLVKKIHEGTGLWKRNKYMDLNQLRGLASSANQINGSYRSLLYQIKRCKVK